MFQASQTGQQGEYYILTDSDVSDLRIGRLKTEYDSGFAIGPDQLKQGQNGTTVLIWNLDKDG